MRSGALRIALIYVVVALAWITFSDRVLYSFHNVFSLQASEIINSGKGILFVLITGFFLHKLIRLDEKKLLETNQRSTQADDEVKRLEAIIAKVNNLIIITDTNNYISWVNKAFEDFTGYTLEEVAGYTPATFFVDGESGIDALSYIISNKKALRSFSVEIDCRKKNREKFCVNGEYTPLFDDEKQFTGYIGVYNDITGLKLKQTEATRQIKKLKEIAWLSSHEVRRPLANIVTLVNMMKATPYMSEKVKLLESIDQSAEELEKIVHTINSTIEPELVSQPGNIS